MMQWWTLEDLFTVINRRDLERLIENTPIGDSAGDAGYDIVASYCDRAQRQISEVLGSRAPREGEAIPAVITECVVATAGYYLSFKSDYDELPKRLASRKKDAETMVKSLRDRSETPREDESGIHVIAAPSLFTREYS